MLENKECVRGATHGREPTHPPTDTQRWLLSGQITRWAVAWTAGYWTLYQMNILGKVWLEGVC